MNNDDLTPHWLKPAAVAVLLGTVGLVAIVLALVLLGIADPKPLGTLLLDNNQPVELAADVADHTIYQSARDAVHCPCTIEVTMRQTEGAPIAQYGLWWRTDDSLTVAAINGNGYYAVFDDITTYFIEWQRFTWLLPQGEPNKLRIDLADDGSATLRLNDEIAASFRWSGVSPIEVGYYVETSEGESIVTVERFRVWESEP